MFRARDDGYWCRSDVRLRQSAYEPVVVAAALERAGFAEIETRESPAVPDRRRRLPRGLEWAGVAALVTLAVLAHPAWGAPPSKFDVAYALTQAIGEMDLVRAQLLTEVVYRVRDGAPILGSFAGIEPAMQERITFLLGGRYEGLRAWLTAEMGLPF